MWNTLVHPARIGSLANHGRHFKQAQIVRFVDTPYPRAHHHSHDARQITLAHHSMCHGSDGLPGAGRVGRRSR